MDVDEFIKTVNSMKSAELYELCLETINKAFSLFNNNVHFYAQFFQLLQAVID